MYKSVIIRLALEKYIKDLDWEDFIVVDTSFEELKYAFTKDCPEGIKNDFLKIANQMLEVINGSEIVSNSEGSITTLTRRKNLWNK